MGLLQNFKTKKQTAKILVTEGDPQWSPNLCHIVIVIIWEEFVSDFIFGDFNFVH